MLAGTLRRDAMPKSVNNASSRRESQRMFAGLTSRWTIPWACTCNRPSPTSAMYRAARCQSSEPISFHEVGQRPTRNILHHQVMLIADGQPGMNTDDVGMV